MFCLKTRSTQNVGKSRILVSSNIKGYSEILSFRIIRENSQGPNIPVIRQVIPMLLQFYNLGRRLIGSWCNSDRATCSNNKRNGRLILCTNLTASCQIFYELRESGLLYIREYPWLCPFTLKEAYRRTYRWVVNLKLTNEETCSLWEGSILNCSIFSITRPFSVCYILKTDGWNDGF
jgi:hypothetical protein